MESTETAQPSAQVNFPNPLGFSAGGTIILGFCLILAVFLGLRNSKPTKGTLRYKLYQSFRQNKRACEFVNKNRYFLSSKLGYQVCFVIPEDSIEESAFQILRQEILEVSK